MTNLRSADVDVAAHLRPEGTPGVRVSEAISYEVASLATAMVSVPKQSDSDGPMPV